MTEDDINIIASGSDGNAVKIKNILIDCGISFRILKEHLYDIDILLLTHRHSDHINTNTIKNIKAYFPHIKIYANADVAYKFKEVDKVIGTKPFTAAGAFIRPYEGKHDVPVTYFIITTDEKNIFYATDTNEVNNPDEIPIDICMIEANYDENKLKALSKSYAGKGYDPRKSAHRHLSVEKAKEFYYLNRSGREAIYIELHKSKRFY